jgi:hypothetical protein
MPTDKIEAFIGKLEKLEKVTKKKRFAFQLSQMRDLAEQELENRELAGEDVPTVSVPAATTDSSATTATTSSSGTTSDTSTASGTTATTSSSGTTATTDSASTSTSSGSTSTSGSGTSTTTGQ